MQKKTTKATKAVEVKKAEVKTAEVKAEVKVEAPKAETKEVAAEAKKAPAKKETAKKAATKKAPVKAAPVTEIVLQFQGNEVAIANVEEKVKAQYVADGHRASSIKSLTVYVKPEEHSAYYVINGDVTGRVDLF